MRITLFTGAFLAAGLATSALAAPTSVQVSIGPKLQAKAANTYGVREVDRLAGELRAAVVNSLSRSDAYDGARIELVLADAVPNRPTMKQMGDKPGLSFSSFGVGGARIEGRAIARDGHVTPLSYSWYETDIRQAPYRPTWGDAESTFGRFATRLVHGEALASR